MNMQICDYIIITILIVFIIDYSGFINTIKSFISKIITKGKIETYHFPFKPFDCSLCMTWWTTLILTFIFGPITLTSILICVLCAYSTFFIKDIFYIVKDIECVIIAYISKIINKIL